MKHVLALSILTALLGGCAIVPVGYGHHGQGYSRGDGYPRGQGHYRGDRYQRDNGYYRGYGYRGYGY